MSDDDGYEITFNDDETVYGDLKFMPSSAPTTTEYWGKDSAGNLHLYIDDVEFPLSTFWCVGRLIWRWRVWLLKVRRAQV